MQPQNKQPVRSVGDTERLEIRECHTEARTADYRFGHSSEEHEIGVLISAFKTSVKCINGP